MNRFIVFLMISVSSSVFADAAQELVSALKMTPDKIQEEPGNLGVLKFLKEKGLINIEPDFVADYSHTYYAKSDVLVFGAKLLALDFEYLDRYVGCCVDPGIALVLNIENSQSEYQGVVKFAKDNICSVTSLEKARLPSEVKVAVSARHKKEEVFVLSCKLREKGKNQSLLRVPVPIIWASH